MTRIELVTLSLPRIRSADWATSAKSWLRGLDLNQRPSGYEPDELPTAPPRDLRTPTTESLVEREGFEPSKPEAADLQSAPFNHSGTSPFLTFWSWRKELNPQPTDYKSVALPIELRQHCISDIG